MFSLMSTTNKIEIQSNLFVLLTSLANTGSNTSSDIIRRMNPHFIQYFTSVLNAGPSIQVISLRHDGIKFLLSLYNSPNNIGGILQNNPNLSKSFFLHLPKDRSYVVTLVLNKFNDILLLGIQNSIKSSLVGCSYFVEFIHLFNNTDENIRRLVYNFFIASLKNPETKIYSLSFNSTGSVVVNSNDLVYKILLNSDQPGDLLQSKLSIELLSAYQSITPSYFQSFPFNLTPRFTPRYFAIVNYMNKLLPSVTVETNLPNKISKDIFITGFKLPQGLLKYTLLLFAKHLLLFMKKQIEISKDSSSLMNEYLPNIPDIQQLYTLKSTKNVEQIIFLPLLYEVLILELTIFPSLLAKARINPTKLLTPYPENETIKNKLFEFINLLTYTSHSWIASPTTMEIIIREENKLIYKKIIQECDWIIEGWEDLLDTKLFTNILVFFVQNKIKIQQSQPNDVSLSFHSFLLYLANHTSEIHEDLFYYILYYESFFILNVNELIRSSVYSKLVENFKRIECKIEILNIDIKKSVIHQVLKCFIMNYYENLPNNKELFNLDIVLKEKLVYLLNEILKKNSIKLLENILMFLFISCPQLLNSVSSFNYDLIYLLSPILNPENV